MWSWLFINYIILLWSKCKATRDISGAHPRWCTAAKATRRASEHRPATTSSRTNYVAITLRPDIASTMTSASSRTVSRSWGNTRRLTTSTKPRNACHSLIKLAAPTARGATSCTSIPTRTGPGKGLEWTTGRCFGSLSLAKHPLESLTDNIISLDQCYNHYQKNDNVPVWSKNIIRAIQGFQHFNLLRVGFPACMKFLSSSLMSWNPTLFLPSVLSGFTA